MIQRFHVLLLLLACPCLAEPTTSPAEDVFAKLLSRHLPSDVNLLQSVLAAAGSCTDDNATVSYSGTQNWTRCDPSGSICVDLNNECLDFPSFLRRSGASASETPDRVDFGRQSPFFLHQILTKKCPFNAVRRKDTHSSSTAWIHGAVSAVILTAVGLLLTALVPLLRRQRCQSIVSFLVALAVGNLIGSGFIYLLPQAFDVPDDGIFVWRACTVIIGVYLVHLFERVIELCLKGDSNSHGHSHSAPRAYSESTQVEEEHVQDGAEMSMKQIHRPASRTHAQRPVSVSKVDKRNQLFHCVVWMVMLSDVILSFIHGIDIGVAFVTGIPAGINVSLTILLMEIPHKIGSLAVLVKRRVSFKVILLFSVFLATGYAAGLAIGKTVLDVTLDVWLSAAVGGMFLYIALVILLPEMNATVELIAKTESKSRQARLFFLQNAGIVMGFLITALSMRYGGHILRHASD